MRRSILESWGLGGIWWQAIVVPIGEIEIISIVGCRPSVEVLKGISLFDSMIVVLTIYSHMFPNTINIT